MILVTGNEGFIGSNFIKRFDEPLYLIPDWEFDLTIVPWEEITQVYHFGAITSTTETDIDLLYKANIKFTVQLFDICIGYKIPITYASSASVYGNMHEVINPLNLYAMSKATIDCRANELILNGANIVGLRFYNVYGDCEDHKGNQASPVHQFTKQAKETGVIKVFENSDRFVRDFVWVENVIDCCLIKMSAGIYDVGTSKPISFMKVAKLVADKYNADIRKIPFPLQLEGKYQTYTCARKDFDVNFIKVADYLLNK